MTKSVRYFLRTDCVFSPDDRLVVTGVSVRKGQGVGKLVFFDRDSLERVMELDVSPDSVSMGFQIFTSV